MARLIPEPQVVLAHPDQVGTLQRATDEHELRVEVHAVPWIDRDQAYLMPPVPPVEWAPVELQAYGHRRWVDYYWPDEVAHWRAATTDAGRKARARRIHAAYDRRRRARGRRR